MVSNNLRQMGEFFDSVADDYNEVHMSHIDRGEEFYRFTAAPMLASDDAVQILNLGAGTGLDLVAVFQKLEKAQVHCIDLSEKLLKQLVARFPDRATSITISVQNYLTMHYPERAYDYVMANATLHHFTDAEKAKLYPKLAATLQDEGRLIIGDRYVSREEARERRERYDMALAAGIAVANGNYHLDIPTTLENELGLLTAAGFVEPEIHWQSKNYTIFSVKQCKSIGGGRR